MAAIIRSFRNGLTPITGASRGDLVSGDIVLLTAVDAHTTYSWVIAFAPDGSTATFSGTATASSPGTFTVDEEGAYLIKLTVDAGLGTEDEQFVRLRALTEFGELRLLSTILGFRHLAPDDLIRAIGRDVRLSCSRRPVDDATVVVASVRPRRRCEDG